MFIPVGSLMEQGHLGWKTLTAQPAAFRSESLIFYCNEFPVRAGDALFVPGINPRVTLYFSGSNLSFWLNNKIKNRPKVAQELTAFFIERQSRWAAGIKTSYDAEAKVFSVSFGDMVLREKLVLEILRLDNFAALFAFALKHTPASIGAELEIGFAVGKLSLKIPFDRNIYDMMPVYNEAKANLDSWCSSTLRKLAIEYTIESDQSAAQFVIAKEAEIIRFLHYIGP